VHPEFTSYIIILWVIVCSSSSVLLLYLTAFYYLSFSFPDSYWFIDQH
jgi:hypothetical protein